MCVFFIVKYDKSLCASISCLNNLGALNRGGGEGGLGRSQPPTLNFKGVGEVVPVNPPDFEKIFFNCEHMYYIQVISIRGVGSPYIDLTI